MSDSDGADSLDESLEEFVDLDEEISAVKALIEVDPSDAKSHNKLLELLHKNGDFEELQEKRVKFSEWILFEEDIWIEWIADVRKSGASKEKIEEHFDRALLDHNSPKLWMEKIYWATSISPQFTREKCEEAIAAIGTRYDCGNLIWQLYISFETGLFQGTEKAEKQRDRIMELYTRALRIPTDGIEDIYNEATNFINENDLSSVVSESVKSTYNASCKLAKELKSFENKVKNCGLESDALVMFADYLDFESRNPVRVQMIYERIVEANPNSELAWSHYGNWCETELKIHKVTCRVYQRAIRHCWFSCSLYQQTLLAFERAGESHQKIDTLWRDAKTNAMSTADFGRALYRTYIYLLRRRVSFLGRTDYSSVANMFEEGETVLKEYFRNEWDPKADFRKNAAWFFATLGRNFEKTRKIWDDILASGFGKNADKWIDAVRMERQFGDNEHARKLLNKALNSVSDNPNAIYEYYVQFEREEGTLDQLDKVLDKVNTQIQHRAARPQKKEVPTKAQTKQDKFAKKESFAQKRRDVPLKREKSSGAVDSPTNGAKRPRLETIEEAVVHKATTPPPLVIDSDGFAMPTLPALRKSSSGSSPSSPNASPVRSSLSPNSSKPTNNAKQETGTARASHSALQPSENGKYTVFVSNLDFKAKEEDIREVLDEVVEVRFVYRPGANARAAHLHRGFAFVDFDTQQAALTAIAKDRILVQGRPMFVSESNAEKRVGFKYATGLEKTKLFVRNINFKASEEHLKDLFTQFGAVREVRIVTHKSGQPKGIGYVEFETEDGAEKALSAVDLELLGRTLSVALSNPPRKGEPSEPIFPLGAGVFDSSANLPRKGHSSMLQLVPRSARTGGTAKAPAAKPTTAPGKPQNSNGNSAPKPMSNEQFRKFISS